MPFKALTTLLVALLAALVLAGPTAAAGSPGVAALPVAHRSKRL
jgi:hypothetical protein